MDTVVIIHTCDSCVPNVCMYVHSSIPHNKYRTEQHNKDRGYFTWFTHPYQQVLFLDHAHHVVRVQLITRTLREDQH